MNKICIINTGGTFNKVYNPLTGELDIPKNSNALESIMITFTKSYPIKEILFKDSLEMKLNDRQEINSLVTLLKEEYHSIIIIHGTDTMELTAHHLADFEHNANIILTGAMVPYSIDSIEATANFALALGFAKNCSKNGVYIAMQGDVAPHYHLKKNRTIGKFERV